MVEIKFPVGTHVWDFVTERWSEVAEVIEYRDEEGEVDLVVYHLTKDVPISEDYSRGRCEFEIGLSPEAEHGIVFKPGDMFVKVGEDGDEDEDIETTGPIIH
jgi:hypothetical protein